MNRLKALIEKCRKSDASLFLVLMRHIRYKIAGKNILANNKVVIKGLKNIHTKGLLQIGINCIGFMHEYDRTYLNINGDLIFQDKYTISKGCRFDIGKGAVAKFGLGYVSPMSIFIIKHGITVGDGCAISWGCQFLDEDFHEISYKERREKSPSIEIGNHVWIGSNVTVLKGSRIPDGCVVASGSIVFSVFNKKKCLLAGNPAKIIKENIEWN